MSTYFDKFSKESKSIYDDFPVISANYRQNGYLVVEFKTVTPDVSKKFNDIVQRHLNDPVIKLPDGTMVTGKYLIDTGTETLTQTVNVGSHAPTPVIDYILSL